LVYAIGGTAPGQKPTLRATLPSTWFQLQITCLCLSSWLDGSPGTLAFAPGWRAYTARLIGALLEEFLHHR